MPMIPHAAKETPKHYIRSNFPLPPRCGGREGKSDFRRRMERMGVSDAEALIYDNVEGRAIHALRNCVVCYVKHIKNAFPGRKYEIRVITQGVVKTVAVWRVA